MNCQYHISLVILTTQSFLKFKLIKPMVDRHDFAVKIILHGMIVFQNSKVNKFQEVFALIF